MDPLRDGAARDPELLSDPGSGPTTPIALDDEQAAMNGQTGITVRHRGPPVVRADASDTPTSPRRPSSINPTRRRTQRPGSRQLGPSGGASKVGGVFDHVGFPCGDVETSVAFYTAVFAPLGLAVGLRIPTGPPPAPEVVGLATDGHPSFWLAPGAAVAQELHIAFTAPDRAAVDAVHEAALAQGAEVLHAPRI